MVLLLMLAFFAVVGCVLYLPFFLWFRRRRPTGGGALSAKVNYTPLGWVFLFAQLAMLFAGLFVSQQDPEGDFGTFMHGNAGLVKWWICTIVLFSVAGTLMRGAGIALQRSAPAAESPEPSNTPAPAAQRLPGFHLATIRGVPIFVHRSYLFGGLFIAVMATTNIQGIVGYCAAYAALFAIHESGHAVVARALGLKVHSVDLSGIGGLCRVEVPTRTRDIWLVFSAGLVAQVLVLLLTLAVVAVQGAPASPFGMAVTTTFTWVNAMLFFINLLPGRTFRGSLTDGGVLWGMARHQLGKGLHPFGWNLVPARLFEPSTSLLSVDGLTPEGFGDGIEILNDDTTPMDFVTSILQRHVGLEQDVAIATMVDIHMHGGVLLPFPSREAADAVADAIARDTQAQGHRLVCRAVSAIAPAARAPSRPGA